MDAMTIPDVWSGQDRALTVEDMENMPDDEFRYELDDGVLIVSPAPSTLHQFAVARLTVILSAACPAGLVVLRGRRRQHQQVPAQGAGCGGSAGRLPRVLLPGDAARTRGRGRLTQDPALRPEQEERRLRRLRHPRVLDRRAVHRPSRADRLRASFGRIRADRSCHRRRGVPRGGPVPGNYRAVPARSI